MGTSYLSDKNVLKSTVVMVAQSVMNALKTTNLNL